MEEMEERQERKQKRSSKNRQKSVEVAAASSSTSNDREDLEEEKEFFETHCNWVHCDKDFETQDQLVKVCVKVKWLQDHSQVTEIHEVRSGNRIGKNTEKCLRNMSISKIFCNRVVYFKVF